MGRESDRFASVICLALGGGWLYFSEKTSDRAVMRHTSGGNGVEHDTGSIFPTPVTSDQRDVCGMVALECPIDCVGAQPFALSRTRRVAGSGRAYCAIDSK